MTYRPMYSILDIHPIEYTWRAFDRCDVLNNTDNNEIKGQWHTSQTAACFSTLRILTTSYL